MIKETFDLQCAQQNYDEITSMRKRVLLVCMIVLIITAGLIFFYLRKDPTAAFMILAASLFWTLYQNKKRIAELELKLAQERFKNTNRTTGQE